MISCHVVIVEGIAVGLCAGYAGSTGAKLKTLVPSALSLCQFDAFNARLDAMSLDDFGRD